MTFTLTIALILIVQLALILIMETDIYSGITSVTLLPDVCSSYICRTGECDSSHPQPDDGLDLLGSSVGRAGRLQV